MVVALGPVALVNNVWFPFQKHTNLTDQIPTIPRLLKKWACSGGFHFGPTTSSKWKAKLEILNVTTSSTNKHVKVQHMVCFALTKVETMMSKKNEWVDNFVSLLYPPPLLTWGNSGEYKVTNNISSMPWGRLLLDSQEWLWTKVVFSNCVCGVALLRMAKKWCMRVNTGFPLMLLPFAAQMNFDSYNITGGDLRLGPPVCSDNPLYCP